MPQDEKSKNNIAKIVIAYPFVLILIGILINYFVFGVQPALVALPSMPIFTALVIAATLLLANHIWLMTSTELSRLKHNMRTTPEEWEASNYNLADVTDKGQQELERRHNAHRNATENMVHFVLLAVLFSIVSPATIAAQVLLVGFAVGRLGHSYCYLNAHDGARGIFMSISLASLFGLASYLVMSLFV